MSDNFYRASADGSVLMTKDLDDDGNYAICIMTELGDGVIAKMILGYDDGKTRDKEFEDGDKAERLMSDYKLNIQKLLDEQDE
jgi:hypothetical protein